MSIKSGNNVETDVWDKRFHALFSPDTQLICLGSPAKWAEGPVWLPQSDEVIFSDVKGNRLFIWSEKTGVSIYRNDAHFANGNALDRQGRLITCEHGRRGISRTELNGQVQLLVDRYDSKRLNSPNDVVVKSDGTIWFTDPPYGIISNEEGYQAESEVIGCYVYRYNPTTFQIDVVTVDVQRPNGLAFSPDESVLYVADMSIVDFPTCGNRHLVAFDVVEGSKLTNKRTIAEITPGIPDGFRVDTQGWIYCSCEDGIIVLTESGEKLGKIRVPERVSNCTFGGVDQSTLFITASTSLYCIKLKTSGCQYTHLLPT